MIEILSKLIPYYEESIAYIKAMKPDANHQRYMQERCIDIGICKCADQVFNTSLSKELWVSRQDRSDPLISPSMAVWGELPIYANKPQAIERLQLRVDIMKRLLAEAQSATNA